MPFWASETYKLSIVRCSQKGAVTDDHDNGQPPANNEGGENGQPEENEGGNSQPEENDQRKADEQDEDTVNNVQPEMLSDDSSHAKSLDEAVTPEVLEILKKQQKYTLSSITKCRNKLARLMIDKDNLHEVKGPLDTLKQPVSSIQGRPSGISRGSNV